MHNIRRAILTGIAATSVAFAQDVTIVDSSSVDFQAVLDAASPGDTLLIRAAVGLSTSGQDLIIDKPLRIIGDMETGEPAQLLEDLRIQNVDSGEVLIQNMLPFLFAPNISIVDCDASVWLADIDGASNVLVSGSSSVVIANSELGGFMSVSDPAGPSYGLDVRSSNVTITDSDVLGITPIFDVGRAALFVENSTVHAVNCTFTGPTDTIGLSSNAPGIEVAATGSLIARGCTFIGGDGEDDIDVDPAATFVATANPVHRLSVPVSVHEGEPVTYTFTGPAGDAVALGFSFQPTVAPSPFSNDTLALGFSASPVRIDFLDASGTLSLTSTPVPLLPSVEAATFFVQLFALDPSGTMAFTGSARVITLLDESL